ncbi:MAG: lysophospholipid acyltransferase family protein [Planctomycetota bacterium]|jgi:1-acyl-sn-glycerol-3-phosphate acyltransferase
MNRRAPGRSRIHTLLVWGGIRGTLQLLLTLLYRLRYTGQENMPREGPAIVVGNHQSHLDPVIVGIVVHDRPCKSLARSSLFSFKPFGWAMSLCDAIPLSRGTSDMAAMRLALEELKVGRCVMLFPEGTRSPDGTLQRFLPGLRVLARRSGAPIVPVAVEGGFDIWPRDRRFPRLRGRLAAKAGAPVDPAPYRDDPERLLEELRRRIDAMRLELRAELRERTGGTFPPPGPADAGIADEPPGAPAEAVASAAPGRH